MKAETFKSIEKKAVTNVFNALEVSPFKVQNFINKNMDKITNLGLTIREILNSHGFTAKKLALTDLYQVQTESGLQVSVLQRFGKHTKENRDCYKLDANLNPVLIGKLWYIPVPAPYSVSSFLQSLSDKNRIAAAKEKEYETRQKDLEKVFKTEKKQSKTALKKAKRARNKAVKVLIPVLKGMEIYSGLSPLQLAKVALNRYYKAY